MSTLRLILTLFIFVWSVTAIAAERPIRAEMISSDTVSDTGKLSFLFRVHSDHPLLKEFRILCDPFSRDAIAARWMTKGMFEIHIRKEGLKIPARPAAIQHAEITFNEESFKTADTKEITILSFRWTE